MDLAIKGIVFVLIAGVVGGSAVAWYTNNAAWLIVAAICAAVLAAG